MRSTTGIFPEDSGFLRILAPGCQEQGRVVWLSSALGEGTKDPAFGFQKVPATLHTSNALAVSLVLQTVKNQPTMQETQVRSLGQEGPLEKGMATRSSILAWEIPWTEEPGRLQSMGLQIVIK